MVRIVCSFLVDTNKHTASNTTPVTKIFTRTQAQVAITTGDQIAATISYFYFDPTSENMFDAWFKCWKGL